MISRKKIFYFPGLISAVFIPILFWYYGNRKYEEINISYIDIGIPAKLNKENYINTFEPFRNWNYHKIEVKPNEARKNSKFYISEIKKLQRENKKESGIEFILNDKNSYDDFVSLLNDMQLSKHETYGLDLEHTGHFFVLHSYNDPNKNIATCGGSTGSESFYRESDYYEGYTKFKYQVSQLPKEAFYLIFGFLILLNISMLSIKESLQK